MSLYSSVYLVLHVLFVPDILSVPTNKEVFCVVYDYEGKVDLSKGYCNPKENWG